MKYLEVAFFLEKCEKSDILKRNEALQAHKVHGFNLHHGVAYTKN